MAVPDVGWQLRAVDRARRLDRPEPGTRRINWRRPGSRRQNTSARTTPKSDMSKFNNVVIRRSRAW